jgi:hypothetical protein
MAIFCRESIECCPGIVSRYFVNFCIQFRWPQWLQVWQSISCSTFSEFLYLYFYTLISFQLPFVLHSYRMVLLHHSVLLWLRRTSRHSHISLSSMSALSCWATCFDRTGHHQVAFIKCAEVMTLTQCIYCRKTLNIVIDMKRTRWWPV